MHPNRIYKVFVSSTYEDLREERSAIQMALLQLNCLPVGMERFPAANEEAWSFIQRQIDDCDYYVVIVAGRYGSLADDGLSFTEKEYDYALKINKPSIGFIHAEPGQIVSAMTERSPDLSAKLESFKTKVMKRLVRKYRSADELAKEVTTSFVQLLTSCPAEGYVRASQAVDYKTYAVLLEQNMRLQRQLEETQSESKNVLRLLEARETIHTSGEGLKEYDLSLKDIFYQLADAIIIRPHEPWIARAMASALLPGESLDVLDVEDCEDEAYLHEVKRSFVSMGLIDLSPGQYGGAHCQVWKLTPLGRETLQHLIEERKFNNFLGAPQSL